MRSNTYIDLHNVNSKARILLQSPTFQPLVKRYSYFKKSEGLVPYPQKLTNET